MYESHTYETILGRMLNRIPDDLDKREGSVIFDALAPAAAELAGAYIELDRTLRLGFAGTSSGEFLDRKAAEQGLVRRQATKAIRGGSFNVPVAVGERFYKEGLYYAAKTSGTSATLECESPGAVGNAPGGTLQPVNHIEGLTAAVLGPVLVPGTDTESDSALYVRYREKVTRPATSGNAAQYKQWALEVPGVGDAKVFSLWNGPLTVKVVLLGPDQRAPSAQVVADAAAYIESQRPIGAVVTVVAAEEIPVHMTVDVTLSGGTQAQAKAGIEQEAGAYLKSLAFKDPIVRYVRLANVVLEAPGVQDYTGFLLNGGSANLTIPDGAVAVLGTVTVT
ncbi:baseplate J/gp47 family protein [Gorillibacterium sp. sgz5001074]|uniref:baseplate J/gp47 family protein n=1 Tax=Gorillibacterium sp. sgz5001074 TaxID=3446695 RepID=UPI003F668A68